MPVKAGVLPVSRVTTPEQMDLWMTAPADEALSVQRPAPKEMLRIVAQGEKKDASARNKIQLSWSPRLTGAPIKAPPGPDAHATAGRAPHHQPISVVLHFVDPVGAARGAG